MPRRLWSLARRILKTPEPAQHSEKRLVVIGLGNPGVSYSRTRHNVGFWVCDELAVRYGLKFRERGPTLTADAVVSGNRMILIKPQTFMNRSGLVLGQGWIAPRRSQLLVIYDDVDLEPGRIRLRERGSAGGHRGMSSLIAVAGTVELPRLRIGIGRPPAGVSMPDWVLSGADADAEQLAAAVRLAADAVECVLSHGIADAMQQYNRIDG